MHNFACQGDNELTCLISWPLNPYSIDTRFGTSAADDLQNIMEKEPLIMTKISRGKCKTVVHAYI